MNNLSVIQAFDRKFLPISNANGQQQQQQEQHQSESPSVIANTLAIDRDTSTIWYIDATTGRVNSLPITTTITSTTNAVPPIEGPSLVVVNSNGTDNTTEDETTGTVVYATFLLEEKLYFVLHKNGHYVSYDSYTREVFENILPLQPKSNNDNVIVTIDDAKFSNDQELLAIATNTRHMLLFNKHFLLQASYDMKRDEYGADEQVNVNWGSKSTQFHGQGMRDARKIQKTFQPLHAWDDHKCCLDWRGDDNYFVINLVVPGNNNNNNVEENFGPYRVLKVFNREGTLQHTSEYVSGLQKCIAWKPSGSLIATNVIANNGSKQKIVLYEKNGLPHLEFDIPVSSTISNNDHTFVIAKISWSLDSEVLLVAGFTAAAAEAAAVANNEVTINDQFVNANVIHTCLLFTTSNYKWFHKLTLNFPHDSPISDICWDYNVSNAAVLLLFSSLTGKYHRRLLSRSVAATETGTILVVDGERLCVSDFANTLVPPPLCTYSIMVKSDIDTTTPWPQSIALLAYTKTQLAIILTTDVVIIFDQSPANLSDFILDHHSLYRLPDYPSIWYEFHNVTDDFAQCYKPRFYAHLPGSGISRLTMPVLLADGGPLYGLIGTMLARFDHANATKPILERLLNINQSISSPLVAFNHRTQLLLYTDSRKLLCYDIPTNKCVEHRMNIGLMTDFNLAFCYDDKVIQLWVTTTTSDPISKTSSSHIIAWTASNSLYYDHILVASSVVNSVWLHDNKYLLYATMDNNFYCWPLENFSPSTLTKHYPPRQLERGAKILTSSIAAAKVILQMPRGNLEAIYPRVLLLDQVEHSLEQMNYVQALEVLRRHRISLNYICDYNLSNFLQHTDKFVSQLDEANRIDWIALFLSELSPTNSVAVLKHDHPQHHDGTSSSLSSYARIMKMQFTITTIANNSGQQQLQSNNNNNNNSDDDDKVNRVCDTLRATMMTMRGRSSSSSSSSSSQSPPSPSDYEWLRFIDPLLLTYIKKEKSEIKQALMVVKSLPERKHRDAAIKYLLYMVNVNRLLDEALGTYDFDIYLMVAGKSNKDPKEYLPLVEQFKVITNEHYRRYCIDLHLHRYASALRHLGECCKVYYYINRGDNNVVNANANENDDNAVNDNANSSNSSSNEKEQTLSNYFREALELIEQRHLFTEAIEIFELNHHPFQSSSSLSDASAASAKAAETAVDGTDNNNSSSSSSSTIVEIVIKNRNAIWHLYGEYLFKKKYYTEAAIAFDRAGAYMQTFKMYAMCANWPLASVAARKAAAAVDNGGEGGEIVECSNTYRANMRSLAQQFSLNGQHVPAAYITEHYLKEPEQAFQLLLNGQEWDHAIQCVADHKLDHNKQFLLEHDLQTALLSAYESKMEQIDELQTKLMEYFERLCELQIVAANAKESNDDDFDHDLDTYSDTSSIRSGVSGRSQHSNASTLRTNRSSATARARHVKKLEQRRYALKRGAANEDIALVYALKQVITESAATLFRDSGTLIRTLYQWNHCVQSCTLQCSLSELHSMMSNIVQLIWKSTGTTNVTNDGDDNVVVGVATEQDHSMGLYLYLRGKISFDPNLCSPPTLHDGEQFKLILNTTATDDHKMA